MKNLEFKSQVATTREQSERLLALGLKKETADCGHCSYGGTYIVPKYPNIHNWDNDIPAWSLHRLVEMIPFTIWHTEHENSPRLEHTFWFSKYAPNYNSNEDIDFREYPNLYDNIIDCIEWLINEGHFNKDYLEEKL